MGNNVKSIVAASAVLAVIAAGSAVYVHAAEDQKPHSRGDMMGGMMQGGHGEMMGMMQQMNKMMEGCTAMMKDTYQQRGRDAPKVQKKPAQQR